MYARHRLDDLTERGRPDGLDLFLGDDGRYRGREIERLPITRGNGDRVLIPAVDLLDVLLDRLCSERLPAAHHAHRGAEKRNEVVARHVSWPIRSVARASSTDHSPLHPPLRDFIESVQRQVPVLPPRSQYSRPRRPCLVGTGSGRPAGG